MPLRMRRTSYLAHTNVSQAFVTVALLNILRFAFSMLPFAIRTFTEVHCLSRVMDVYETLTWLLMPGSGCHETN
jgi:hypothetical protein